MNELFHKIALRFERLSYVIWGLFLLSLGVTLYILFASQNLVSVNSELLFFVLTAWFASMLALSSYFRVITPKAPEGTGFLKRIVIVTRRGFSAVVAVTFSLATVMAFWLSIRAISLAL